MRAWAVLFACLLLAAPAAAQTKTEAARAAKLCQDGAAKLKAGDVPGAEADYREALKNVPNHPDAFAGLGHAAMKKGDFKAALENYVAAKKAYVELVKKRADDADAGYYQKRMAEDQARDDKTQLQNPQLSVTDNYRNTQGAALDKRIDENRRADAPGTERRDGVPAEFDFLIGNAQFRLGMLDDARARWEGAGLAEALGERELRMLDDARASWEASAAARPDFAPVQLNLAVLALKQRRCDEAKTRLAAAQKLGAKAPEGLLRDVAACAPSH